MYGSVGAAILSNFAAAEKAMDTMANSAGSAENEMEKITNSIEYKLNELKETWVGVAQSLFESEGIKVAASALQGLANIVDALTNGFGLFGTAGIAVAIAGLFKLRSAASTIQTNVTTVLQSLSGVRFDDSTASVVRYATALNGLSDVERDIAIRMFELKPEQIAQIDQYREMTNALVGLEIAELSHAMGLKSDTLASKLNISANAEVTDSVIRAIYADEELRAKLIELIAAKKADTNANRENAQSYDGINGKTFSALSSMSHSWSLWSTVVTVAITAVTGAIRLYQRTQEEARQRTAEAARAFVESSDSIDDYKEKIKELKTSLDSGNLSEEEAYDTRKALLSIKDELVSMYGDEARQLDLLTGSATKATEALDNLNRAQASEFLTKEASGIDKAIREMEKVRQYSFTAISTGNDEVTSKLKDILAKYDVTYSELDSGDIFISMGKNARDADEIINGLATDFRSLRNELEKRVDIDITGDLAEMFNYIEYEFQEAGKKVDEILDTYSSDYDSQVRAKIIEDVDYSSLMKSVQSAQDAYKEALASGDLGAQDLAIRMIQSVSDEIANTDFENDPSVGIFFDDLVSALEEESAKTAVKVRIRTELENEDVGNPIDNVISTIQAFADEEGAIIKARIEGYEQLKKNSGILSGYSDDEVAAFDALDAAASDYGVTVSELIDLLSQLGYIKLPVADISSNYREQASSLIDVISDLKTLNDVVASAQKDMENGGGLSVDTIKKLSELEEDYLSYLYEENGVVKLNTELWKKNAAAKVKNEVANVRNEIKRIEENNAALRKNIELYKSQRSISANREEWDAKIAEATAEIENNNDAVANLHTEITILQSSLNDTPTSIANVAESIDDIKTGISTLKTAYDELENSQAISHSTLSSIRKQFEGSVDDIDSYISRLAAVKGNTEEAAQIMDELIVAMIESSNCTEDLASADENLVAAMLKEAGIANSTEQAHRIVSQAKIKNAAASIDLKNATDDTFASLQKAIEALSGEGDAADYAKNYIIALRMEQILLNDSQLNMTSSIDQLIALAETAGETVSALEILRDVQSGGKQMGGIGDLRESDYAAENAELRMRQIIEKLKTPKSSDTSGYTFTPSQSSGGGSGGSSTKEVEEYLAEIDKLRKQLYEVQQIKDDIDRENAKFDLLDEEDFAGQIEHHQKLLGMYQKEQTALHTLAEARRDLIAENVQKLTGLGFDIDYDSDYNTIFVKNLERINELKAANEDSYATLQEATEATNEYRKEIEELISSTTEMVEANRENSDSWWELEDSIKSARSSVVDTLIAITDAAHDALDEIQNVASTLSAAAQEFADNDGWISVDTYQSILGLGTEYMQMLVNENDELVINRDRINAIIEAKTRQLAVDQALSYVERLRLAATGQSNESLDRLCFATTQATDSTWGLVYAELALMKETGLLSGDQYEAAMHNVQAIQSLAETAIAGIGETADAAAEQLENLKKQLEDQKDALNDLVDELNDMKDGCDDLVKYVMDMLKDKIEQQVDALTNAKNAVKEYVDQLKESMRAEKENADYEDELAEKINKIAKLQSKIDALSLDDSRKAQAEKKSLEEELAALQKDLADTQAEHALDVTEDALDKQYEAYEDEKDAEIEKLKESISSTQKLWSMSIEYIRDHWDTLYSELIDWNTEYGSIGSYKTH